MSDPSHPLVPKEPLNPFDIREKINKALDAQFNAVLQDGKKWSYVDNANSIASKCKDTCKMI